MAYGKIKADAIIRDNGGSDEEITMATIVGLDSGKAPKANPTFTGTVTVPAVTATGDITLNAQNGVKFADSDSSNFIELQAPGTVSTNSTWTLPSDAPAANDVLKVTSVSSNNPTLEWGSVSQVLKKIHYHEFSTRVASVNSNAGDKMTFVSNFQPLDPANNDLFFHIVIPADGAGNNWSGAGIRFEGNGSSSTDFEKYGGMAYPGATSYQSFYIHSFNVAAGTFSGSGSDTFSVHHHLDNAGGSNIEDYNPNSSDEVRVTQQTVTTMTVWEYKNS